jgi:phage-related protein
MFYAKNFIFDNVPSEFYNLYIGEFGGEGESTTAASSDVSLLTQKLFRRPVPFFWGAEQLPVLQFSLSIYSPIEINAPDYSLISSWLFGQQNYKQLRICQNDMMDIYFNCFLTNPQVMRIGNIIRGFTMNVVCDSPFAWKNSKTITYYYGDYLTNTSINFYNESANNFYTFPASLIVASNIYGGTIQIQNDNDNNRLFAYTAVANELITFNCDTQTISSNLMSYALPGFNLNWLRLVRGTNNLALVGNINYITIQTGPIAVKVGG